MNPPTTLHDRVLTVQRKIRLQAQDIRKLKEDQKGEISLILKQVNLKFPGFIEELAEIQDKIIADAKVIDKLAKRIVVLEFSNKQLKSAAYAEHRLLEKIEKRITQLEKKV